MNKVIKVSFAVIGGFTGVTVANMFIVFKIVNFINNNYIKFLLYIIMTVFTAFIFLTTANIFLDRIIRILDKFEDLIHNMTLYELGISSFGLIIGLIIANLISIPIIKVDVIGVPLAIAANILFGCMGIIIAAGKRSEVSSDWANVKSGIRRQRGVCPKIIDTSALIDGRIVDIIRSGFLEGDFVIPEFVLVELRHIADSPDMLKRNRGRRGLDVLNMMQKELECNVRIENAELPKGTEVDSELLKMAKRLKGKIITTDFNLNKVASVRSIPVMNVNELANAVKPIALPGEEIIVQVIKDGKENGQGIGYMDDGTMIVVDGGKSHIGETISVMVTSVLQTPAGRMIFGKA